MLDKIPSDISNLSKLELLSISDNELTGFWRCVFFDLQYPLPLGQVPIQFTSYKSEENLFIKE